MDTSTGNDATQRGRVCLCVPQDPLSLCPQGTPGASGLKGDKVHGIVQLAVACTHDPLQLHSPLSPFLSSLASYDPLLLSDSPHLPWVNFALQGDPGAGLPGIRGERGEPGVRVCEPCSAATAHDQCDPFTTALTSDF